MSLELALKSLIHEVLAEAGAFEPGVLSGPATPAPAAPVKRGRGRPVVGESPPPATTATATGISTPSQTLVPASAVESDPFATTTPAAPEVPAATLDQVRDALKALKAVTSQETALKVLKDFGGAPNLTELKADKYGVVADAAQKATVAAGRAAAGTPNAADDPFATPAETVVQETVPTLEELKALIVETQKRASAATVQAIVMKAGGKKATPEGDKPNLTALPVTAYLAVAAELKALPTTK